MQRSDRPPVRQGGLEMDRVAIVTDSSACLPPPLAKRPGVRVLPIAIHLGGDDLHDGEPGAASRVYASLARREEVKSTAPSPLEYLAAIEEAEADAVTVITPAPEFTVMHRNACVAADLAGRPAVVVDSRTAAAAQGLVVAEALEAAESGSLEDVVTVAEETSRGVRLVATLETLEFVRNSGRVPPAAFELAQHLGVRPIFELCEGAVERVGIARGREAAVGRIRQEWAERGGLAAGRTWVFHADRADVARDLQGALGDVEVLTEFSASMGVHTGPGVVGVAWIPGG